MKPVTDDMVFSILENLEKREQRRGLADLSRKVFGPVGAKRMITLNTARSRAQTTINGLFCYVASRTGEAR